MTEYTDCCECLTEDEQPGVCVVTPSNNGSLLTLGLIALGYMALRG